MSKIIVINGPTGVGKTRASIELAKYYDAEIINADSMQIYKELNIGTAKIADEEKQNIKHHLLDVRSVNEDYSVCDYQKEARKIIDNLILKNKNIIIVGGTGLYVKALLYDYKFDDSKTTNTFDEYSNEELFNMIKSKEVHVNNRKRMIRLLNKLENNDNTDGNNLIYENVYFIGLTTNREKLYEIINKRVDLMIESNLLDEVKYFYKKNINSKAINTAIGYKELYLFLDKKISFEDAINLIKKRSRNYAKRQYTWYRNKMNINWFEVNFENFNETLNEICCFINNN